MKCPFCSTPDTKVTDSRLSRDGGTIRRRRKCGGCNRRFTTYERVEEVLPLVVKKDGRREVYDRHKVVAGIKRACEKRPVSIEDVERMVDEIEQRFQESGERELPSARIGEAVMARLKDLDQVAYVRFASVYRSFRDVNEFMQELSELLAHNKKRSLRG